MNQSLAQFQELIQPCADTVLEEMSRRSQALTLRHFGRTMRLFAPLYLSNECVNGCPYCGFSRGNSIARITLAPVEVEAEASHLLAEGFRNILLVAGEHPKKVSVEYLEDCVARVHRLGAPSINMEIGSLETGEYRSIVTAGAEGLVLYQETYDREAYARLHPAGPKKDYDRRFAAPDRAYAAGFRRIGIGILLGLADWRRDAMAMAEHLDGLLKRCWKSFFTVSLPRLRPAASGFRAPVEVTERDLIQLVCAFRICFPQVGLVLSTREPPHLRDVLLQCGITLISAGSHTEPGGYTRVKRNTSEDGTPLPVPIASAGEYATEQFTIADNRPVGAVVERIRELGYDPVWKDWDPSLNQ
jgi:2-iminoacetate synthase